MNKIDEFKKYINECNNIVFFGGAGVSTASGIKDFRSSDGLYNMKFKYPAEVMLSNNFFYDNPMEFWDFYKTYMNSLDAKPNFVHKYLTKLEKDNKLLSIITQNIDGLHSKAGSKNIHEIHGTIYKNHCLTCNKEYEAEYIFKSKSIPLCTCGGRIKPDVVLYGEMLPECFDYAINDIKKADMLIVAGTSLSVYPAASLINFFNGKYIVLINKDKTIYDNKATLVFNEDMNKIFKKL